MKAWGCAAIAWAAVWLALGWREVAGGAWLGLAALAIAPMVLWVLAWAKRREIRGLRAVEIEALTWEQSESTPPH